MDNLGFGLSTTLVGMGSVFALLLLLMGLLVLLGRLDRHAGDLEAGTATVPVPSSGAAADAGPGTVRSVDDGDRVEASIAPELLAAIAVAVTTHAAAIRGGTRAFPTRDAPVVEPAPSRWLATGRARQVRPWRG